jgi:hypothetical protein
MIRQALFLIALLLVPLNAHAAERDDLTVLRSEIATEFVDDFTVMAVCGASSGMTFFRDEALQGWQQDTISQGRYIFVQNLTGERDVYFMDARGEFASALQDGGTVTELYLDPDRRDFMWAVIYFDTGVTEIYNVTYDSGRPAIVLWSSNKPSLHIPTTPPVTLGPKVAAFVANCA